MNNKMREKRGGWVGVCVCVGGVHRELSPLDSVFTQVCQIVTDLVRQRLVS